MTAIASIPPQRVPPGPRGSWLWGNLRDVQRDPLQFYRTQHVRYGDIVRFRSVRGFHWYLLAHPDHIEHVLRVNAQNYVKGVLIREVKNLVGEGILTSEGDTWLRNRRLAQPAFHRKRLAVLGDVMTGAAERLGEQWYTRVRDDRPFDVMRDMMSVTLDIVAQALFSIDASSDAHVVGPALATALTEMNYRALHVFVPPLEVPTAHNRRYVRARGTLDRIVYHIIDERRHTG